MSHQLSSTLVSPKSRLRRRCGFEPPSARHGLTAARRLARQLESLEESLRAAERTATASRSSHQAYDLATYRDIASRLSEIEQHELELQARERTIEHHRMLAQLVQHKLVRTKETLKRAIYKLRDYTMRRTQELDARARRVAVARAELIEARREFTREQIRWKAALRQSSRFDHAPLSR